MRTESALIESDEFPFEFLSEIGERESWRKEIHRPVYHLHKWWAQRLGSVFRGILLGAVLDPDADLPAEFYASQAFSDRTVLDPFMGSGTTIGEAHKLGFIALGRDINPVAVESVRTAFGPMDVRALAAAFTYLQEGVGQRIRDLYRAKSSMDQASDVLYNFWVMQASCPRCARPVDLFSSYIFARNAYPKRKPEVQVLCPECGEVFEGRYERSDEVCRRCAHRFDPTVGSAKGPAASCPHCGHAFRILDAFSGRQGRPDYRLYAKLVLRPDGEKEYVRATASDLAAYARASDTLSRDVAEGGILLPTLALEHGHNTRQAMRYGFTEWRDFFNDRQLLALGWLRTAIATLPDEPVRRVMLTLFSGLLEFNNMFASYKGEGTGAVRHMFSHHILKPERTPIEANVWGTPKSSGSFSGLYKSRLLRAVAYRARPTEIGLAMSEKRISASPSFTGIVDEWPSSERLKARGIYLSCGDSSALGLRDKSVDLVVTDPPFFDNVHYSELADFFHAWQQIGRPAAAVSTRSSAEVQDTEADSFSRKLKGVFRECHRVLRDDGLLIFTYHHSREEGWHALAQAVLGAGFVVVNSQPVKGEMSGATPVAAAKEPISFDMVLACRKSTAGHRVRSRKQAVWAARNQLARLTAAGFTLSRNDRRVVEFGQLLTTVASSDDAIYLADHAEIELDRIEETTAYFIRVPSKDPASDVSRKRGGSSSSFLPRVDRSAR